LHQAFQFGKCLFIGANDRVFLGLHRGAHHFGQMNP
jgi:hypothetical protein